MLSNFDEMGEGYHLPFFAPIGCLFLLRLVIRTARARKQIKQLQYLPQIYVHGETQTISRSDMDMFCLTVKQADRGCDFCTTRENTPAH